MNAWLGRALIGAANSCLIAGVHLWLGAAPALFVAALVLYVVGHDLSQPAPASLPMNDQEPAPQPTPRFPREWIK